MTSLDPAPRVPAGDAAGLGIGIVGCGRIVRDAHLSAYRKYGLRVAGVYDIDPAAVVAAAASYDIGRAFASLEELLADPGVAGVVRALSARWHQSWRSSGTRPLRITLRRRAR